MKVLALLVLVMVSVSVNAATKWYDLQSAMEIKQAARVFDTSLSERWNQFKKKYSKNYGLEEEKSRYQKFANNVAMIDKHNEEEANGMHTYTLAVNKFADLDNLEARKMLNGFKRMTNYTRTGSTYLEPSFLHKMDVDCDADYCDDGLPREVDWRTDGYVTPVKDQGQCGACYAFSATGSLEGQHFKKTNNLVSLSEQNIADCSRSYGNEGCAGGLMTYSFNYIRDNKGVDTEESYPYSAWEATCEFSEQNVGATVTGYVELPQGDEKKLKQAIATVGPISAAIDSSQDSFIYYESGIYQEPLCSLTHIDHAILIVGYGRKNSVSYWIVKNSWGAEWGEGGYIRMARNMDNQCGIAMYTSYPLV